MTDLPQTLGARIRLIRQRAKLTQAECARAIGVHQPNWAAWEADVKDPAASTLFAIAKALRVKADALRPR